MIRPRSISLAISSVIAVMIAVVSLCSATAQASPQVMATPVPGHFVVNDARIHYQPDLNSPSAGLGYLNHSVTLYCRTYSLAFYSLRDNTTGVEGWASDMVVYANGASPGYC